MAAALAVPDGEGTITVFIADDVPELRELIRFGLEEDADFVVVGDAADGRGAIEGVELHAPSVLDLSMPDVDGFQAVLEIRSRRPEVAIIVLSGFAADRMRRRDETGRRRLRGEGRADGAAQGLDPPRGGRAPGRLRALGGGLGQPPA